MKKGNYISGFIGRLKESFRLPIRAFSLTVLFDLLLYVTLLMGLAVMMRTINSFSTGIPIVNLEQQITNPLVLTALNESLLSFMFKSIIAVILFIIFMGVVWGVFKGYIWDTLEGKTPTPGRTYGYMKLGLTLMVGIYALMSIFALLFKTIIAAIAILALIPISLHLTLFVFREFSKSMRIGKALKRGLMEGLMLHRYILPYVLMLLIYVIVFQHMLFRIVGLLPMPMVVGVITGIMTLIFVGWGRYYLILNSR